MALLHSPQKRLSATMALLRTFTQIAAFTACFYASGASASTKVNVSSLPSQAVLVDKLSYTVLGNNGNFRQSATAQLFNPTNATPPFFQVFDSSFLSILGDSPSIRVIASDPDFAFAHEAPIWLPETDQVTFASHDGGALSMSGTNNNNQVNRINLKDVSNAIHASGSLTSAVNVTFTKLNFSDSIQMTNGGTGPYNGQLVLANSGRGNLPPSLALANPQPPYNVTVLLDNFFGRQFNSLNDVKIYPGSNKFFFTDPDYGYLSGFRPLPLLPNQVYRFDPDTGSVRVVADGFDKCNGIAFSPDGKSAFVTDTGSLGGIVGNNQTEPATIYKFDVDSKTHGFLNRRVFAYVDTGIPDGIQLDTNGNVYSGCADGVQVWNPDGDLIGKFFLGTTSSNLIFAGKGRLVIMAETAVYLAQIAASGFDVSFPRGA